MGVLDLLKDMQAKQQAAMATRSVANDAPTNDTTALATKSMIRSGVIPNRDSVIGAPHTRRGEDALTSRVFSYQKALGLMSGRLRPDQCRVEVKVMDAFVKSLQEQYPGWGPLPGHFCVPLSISLLEPETRAAIKSEGFVNGTASYDPDEVEYVRQITGAMRPGFDGATKAMGTFNYQAGATLVPNPAHGDLIRLARNTPGLLAAGAQTVAIPPQGAIEFPRGKSPTTVDAVDGEGDTFTESEYDTDAMKLEAKMITGGSQLSNKLIMMSQPAAETVVQEDLIISTLLKFDFYGFYGPGGIYPRGIKNMVADGVTRVTPSTVAATGDTLKPEDFFTKFWTPCAQANREFSGWIMNPRTYAQNTTFRADSGFASGDKAGLFVNRPFDPLGRALENWFGYKVTWTNQVKVSGTKGSGTGLADVFGGPWQEAVIGLFGAIQILINPYETTAYNANATKIRVTGLGDFNLRYPAAFAFAEQLTN